MPTPKPYRIGLLFAHKNGKFGKISNGAKMHHAVIPKVESNIYRIGVHTPIADRFSCRPVKCEQSLLPT